MSIDRAKSYSRPALSTLLVVLALMVGSGYSQSSSSQTLAGGTGGFLANAQSPASGRPLVRINKNVTNKKPFRQIPQTYVVKLSDDPVAVVQGRMPGKVLSETDRSAIASALSLKQDAIVPSIEAMGGKVLAKFQHAVNGIKVRATPEQAASIATLPGVVAVKPVQTYHLDNALSVPYIGAPQVWQNPPGLHGEHIKIAIIDTGIDYTHANFGGPGTVAAFQAAAATSTQPADPSLFGPNAPKVKGGIDLVGDAYNANDPNSVPVPDPNPLDCAGHGSHVAGTAAGFGVTSFGDTYIGPYDNLTPNENFIIGPGVAPLADLYAVRVFGCAGSTNVVVDAIDWAVQNNMQVINMSLGSSFGTEDSADAEASENAVDAGIVVATSAGNSGPIPYIVGSPSTGEKVISTAAVDSHLSFPAETLALSTGKSIVALDANGIALPNGTTLPIVVLPDTKGTGKNGVSLGCDPAEYMAAGVAGKLVVTVRGTCARVARAIFGQQAGAAAVAMINNSPGYPPYEGPITSNPDTGTPFTVTIPFLGIQGPPTSADANAVIAASSATFTSSTIANPTARQIVSFSSAGPRNWDGHLKPNISAPGVSIFSTAIGTGNQGVFFSGTSMASPHVAGTSALAVQAHPTWKADQVAAAIVNTADSSKVSGFSPQLAGNGLVQPFPAVLTSVIARAEADGTPSLSFGVTEFTQNFTGEADILVENHGSSPARFSVSTLQSTGAAHTVKAQPATLLLGPSDSKRVHVKLSVPLATVGDSSAFRQVQGQILLKSTSGNNGVSLSVPYYLVPRARSEVIANLLGVQNVKKTKTANVRVANHSGAITGTADFYAWGLSGENSALGYVGLRAVGVQSFTDPTFGQVLVFAVNTFARTSNPDSVYYEIDVDSTGDGVPDYAVFAEDAGLLTTGTPNGELAVFVFDIATKKTVGEFLATAPTDGSTVLLPLVAGDIGVTSSNQRFSYTAFTQDIFVTGNFDQITTPAKFNAFNNAIATGAFAVLPPHSGGTVPLVINPAEAAVTPSLGEMIVSLDNLTADGDQALLLSIPEN